MHDLTDPAWLYSSLAQSSASLVGLMGAILAARIVDHIGLTRVRRADLYRQAIRPTLQDVADRVTHLNRVRESLKGAIVQVQGILGTDLTGATVHMQSSWSSNSISSRDVRLPDVSSFVASSTESLERVEDAIRIYERRRSPLLMEQSLKKIAFELQEKADSARTIDSDAARLLHHDSQSLRRLAESIAEYRTHLLPSSFGWVIVLLAWLMLFGLLLPLLALPGFEGVGVLSKPVLLGGVLIGLLGLLGYLVFQLVEMRSLGRLDWPEEMP